MTAVDVASLNIGNQLADGGQGTVYELSNDPSQVFKRYHNPDHPRFTATTLRRLVTERDSIGYAGQAVDEFAAWPNAVVVDGAKTVGFLMHRVPTEFSLRLGQTTRLADLSYLATPPKPIWGDVDLPGPGERIEIVRHLARAMDALHQRRIVVGDVSFANVLWSCDPRPRIMLLDCDGMRLEGERPVLPQPDTVDWNDPHAKPGAEPDRDRDRYKLALAVLRVLTTRLDARPDDGSPLPDMEQPIKEQCEKLLAGAAGDAGSRPPAGDWAGALSGRRFQPTLPVGAVRQDEAPPPNPEMLPQSQRQFRPVTPPGRQA